MSQFIRIYDENPNPKEISKVVNILKNGGLVIYPTDTVYGLGCDISNNKALEKIARIKGIKLEKADLSFICYDLSNLSQYVKQIDTPTYKILKRALPGAYTFILNGNNNLPKVFKKKKTVGIRIPDNNIVREIVKELGNPIVTTSIRDEDDLNLTTIWIIALISLSIIIFLFWLFYRILYGILLKKLTRNYSELLKNE